MVPIFLLGFIRKIACALLLAAGIFFGMVPVVFAQDVVLLIDTSASMNDSDAMHVVPDGVRELLAVLPKEDRIAIICYDTEARMIQPMIGCSEWREDLLPAITYQRYTNTGAAMQMALKELPKDGSIVILTDGEIMLPTTEGTLDSLQLFNIAIEEAAKRGIQVDIFSLQGKTERPVNFLHTGYAKDTVLTSQELLSKLRLLAKERFHASFMELDAEVGPKGKFAVELPFSSVKNANIFVEALSEGKISAQDKEMRESLHGKFFAGFEKDSHGNHIDFESSFPEGTKLKIVAMPAMDGYLEGKAYSLEDGSLAIEIVPMIQGGKGMILNHPYFEGKSVSFELNGETVKGTITDGIIKCNLQNMDEAALRIRNVDFSSLGFRFEGKNSLDISKEAGRNFSYSGRILIALLVFSILALLACWWYKKSQAEERKPEEKAVPYRGKLVLYVMKHPGGEDIQPVEYNLFRRYDGSEVNLSEVMASCGIKISFPGAERIVIGPEAQGIRIWNRSDCTVTKQEDIVLKGCKKVLQYDESIYIVFQDEKTELLLVYKSQKPSAR